ncbi:hypothetical protein C8R47DRAFT_1153008 [Mycena vitilis]|nr:hypothetical protein C8R47DRAFT_1153008 [Mycena vitilis]
MSWRALLRALHAFWRGTRLVSLAPPAALPPPLARPHRSVRCTDMKRLEVPEWFRAARCTNSSAYRLHPIPPPLRRALAPANPMRLI